MRRSRDRRGGGVQTPPAGVGKSRGPAGRGLINPRSAGGAYSAPSRIFAITSELRKIFPRNFQYLIGHQFDTLSENFVKFGWKIFEKMTFQ